MLPHRNEEMMRFRIFFFFALSIFVIILVPTPVSAEETSFRQSLVDRMQNIGDGFIPPEDETIQYLWDDIIGKQPLGKPFRGKLYRNSLIRILGKNNSSVWIANEIDEIPCGQHHRFTLLVLGGEKQEVFWHSSRPDIARIDAKTGEMTATGEGRVRIWVTNRFGRIKDVTFCKVIPELTQEEIKALYWDESDRFMQDGMVYWSVWGEKEKLILPEDAIVIVDAFSSRQKRRVQMRIPSSVRAITYDRSFEDEWGLHRGEHVTVSVDGNNRNYYSLFGILFSYAFEDMEKPEEKIFETDFMCMADCKYRALLLYPPDRKNEVYYVPDGVERIAGRAFEGAKYLRRVVLPDTVKTIGLGAFAECDKLEEIVIPESVVEFEEYWVCGEDGEKVDLVPMGNKERIVIVTPKGSAAQAYAIEYGIAYRNE